MALDLEDYHPSMLLHCWLGHLTCKIVSKMTYNVSSTGDILLLARPVAMDMLQRGQSVGHVCLSVVYVRDPFENS